MRQVIDNKGDSDGGSPPIRVACPEVNSDDHEVFFGDLVSSCKRETEEVSADGICRRQKHHNKDRQHSHVRRPLFKMAKDFFHILIPFPPAPVLADRREDRGEKLID